jgi:hypothetical protein
VVIESVLIWIVDERPEPHRAARGYTLSRWSVGMDDVSRIRFVVSEYERPVVELTFVVLEFARRELMEVVVEYDARHVVECVTRPKHGERREDETTAGREEAAQPLPGSSRNY